MAGETHNKPVWQIPTRSAQSPDEAWVYRQVRATSALQADAILRRRGYETNMADAVVIDAEARLVAATVRDIICFGCGYSLEGIAIEGGSARCPECGHRQPLAVLIPEADAATPEVPSRWKLLLNLLGLVITVAAGVLLGLHLFWR